MCQFLVPRCDGGGKPGIQPARQDGFDLMNGKQMMQHELGIGLAAPEFAKGLDNHPMPGQRHGNSDSKRPGFAKGNPLGAPFRLINILQDTSRIAQKQFPRRAQSDSSGQSVKQRKSHLAL
jgi:hypothetical protein